MSKGRYSENLGIFASIMAQHFLHIINLSSFPHDVLFKHIIYSLCIMKDCRQWCEKGVFGMTGRPRGATK